MLKASLEAAGIRVELAAGRLAGMQPKNIVNQCRSTRGVQLELSMALRKNKKTVKVLVRIIRSTLKKLKKIESSEQTERTANGKHEP
jgi:phage replication-related protein YjqB (UPF0714/DUF867 family)